MAAGIKINGIYNEYYRKIGGKRKSNRRRKRKIRGGERGRNNEFNMGYGVRI